MQRPAQRQARDTVHPHGADAVGHWDEYVTKWTAWNYRRAAASLAAPATLTSALYIG